MRLLWNEIKVTCIVIACAVLNAFALNAFLIPAHILSSGFTGAAQLLAALAHQYTPLSLNTGVVLFLLNIPVTVLAWLRVGRRFTLYSMLSVLVTTFALTLIPVQALSGNALLNAVFGGVIGAIGVGLTLKYGASTGGMDIIAMILSKTQDRPIGIYYFILNGLIVLSAGFFFGWERALYTMVTLYVTSRVIDAIHTRYVKLTAMIVTEKGEELTQAIYHRLVRGITKVAAKGGYTGKDKDLLLIVLTRYELYTLERIIQETDPRAFTNIVETTEIVGFFRKED